MKLFSSVIPIAVSAVFIASMPAAAATPDDAFTRTISVTGAGEASAKPDRAVVSAGVEIVADTVVQASQENQAVVARIMEALEQQNIAEKNIQTVDYSISAVHKYDQPQGDRIVGYRVSNIVRFTIEKISEVGELLQAVTNAGANSIHGIEFSVSDTEALELKARKAAMADARATAASLASLAGVELGDVLTISASGRSNNPRPYARFKVAEMASAAAPVPDIAPGEQNVGVQVSVVYGIR